MYTVWIKQEKYKNDKQNVFLREGLFGPCAALNWACKSENPFPKFDAVEELNMDIMNRFMNGALLQNKELLQILAICPELKTSQKQLTYMSDPTVAFTTRKKMSELDGKPGVYFIYDVYERLSYIGRSEVNLARRSFISFREKLGSYISFMETTTKKEAVTLEKYLIPIYKPIHNTQYRNDDIIKSIKLPRMSKLFPIGRFDANIR